MGSCFNTIFCNQIVSTRRRSRKRVNDAIFKIKMLWLHIWRTVKIICVLKHTWWTSSWATTAATLCLLEVADSLGSYSRFVSLYVISPQFSMAPVPKSGIAISSTSKEREHDYCYILWATWLLLFLCIHSLFCLLFVVLAYCCGLQSVTCV